MEERIRHGWDAIRLFERGIGNLLGMLIANPQIVVVPMALSRPKGAINRPLCPLGKLPQPGWLLAHHENQPTTAPSGLAQEFRRGGRRPSGKTGPITKGVAGC